MEFEFESNKTKKAIEEVKLVRRAYLEALSRLYSTIREDENDIVLKRKTGNED